MIKSLPGHQGADEVWFNDGDSRYFIAESDNPAGPRVGVVDSILESNELAQTSPIITTTDGKSDPIVWAVGAEGDNRLHGFRGDTGAIVFSESAGSEAQPKVRRGRG